MTSTNDVFDTGRSGLIWCEPLSLEDGYRGGYTHPLYHSPATYKPVWHAVQAAMGRKVLDL